MDILIKNMDMPKCCYSDSWSEDGNCLFHFFAYEGGSHCSISECKPLKTKRPKDCPLVALPEHHGRLIDADFFKEYAVRVHTEEGKEYIPADYIDIVPTILEAST